MIKTRMHRIRKTCLEMIKQREYKLIESTDKHLVGINDKGDRIAVLLDPEDIGIRKIEEISARAAYLKCKKCIAIHLGNVTPVARQAIKNYLVVDGVKIDEGKDGLFIGVRIEIFYIDEVLINITKHRLVPPHRKIKNHKKFTDKYGINHPILKMSDPVRRFYGWDIGDIIQVTRKNGFVVHRIVN
jgi:DNA-directed RNA polymerase subunit H (RpoH/RPB5)